MGTMILGNSLVKLRFFTCGLLDALHLTRLVPPRLVVGQLLASFVICGCPSLGTASLVIRVEDHVLHPDTAGQIVDVSVSGGNLISGLNLFAQIGDGGPELADLPDPLPPGTDGPSFQSVDFKSTTVFAGLTDTATDLGSLPQVAIWSLALTGNTPAVPAAGILVRLQVDTTGFEAGSWDLALANVLPDLGPFDTNFAGVAADEILNGTLSVDDVPGDMNFDGTVDFDDIDSFVLGLVDSETYVSTFGVSPVLRGDADRNGAIDFDDIPGFVAQLVGNTLAVPEPPVGVILAAAAAVVLGLAVRPTFAVRDAAPNAKVSGSSTTGAERPSEIHAE